MDDWYEVYAEEARLDADGYSDGISFLEDEADIRQDAALKKLIYSGTWRWNAYGRYFSQTCHDIGKDLGYTGNEIKSWVYPRKKPVFTAIDEIKTTLDEIRCRENISYADLGRNLGCSRQHARRLLVVGGSFTALEKVAKVLGYTPKVILIKDKQ